MLASDGMAAQLIFFWMLTSCHVNACNAQILCLNKQESNHSSNVHVVVTAATVRPPFGLG